MADVLLKRLEKTYPGGTTAVVRGIDLHVRDGEFVVFVGPSGCGKSTLLRMIAGLESVSGGSIEIGAVDVSSLPPRSRNIAMVFQDYALYPHKTVFDNMAFGLTMRQTPRDEVARQVGAAAQLLRIEDLLTRKPRELSGGQRQRVAIGRAMVRHPEVFLFDEPLSNLDAQLRGEMRSEIKKLHQRLGKTMIYVTHDQVEAMTLADRIAVLKDGEVIQYGTPEEIYSRPTAQFVAAFTGSPAMNFTAATLCRAGERVVIRLGELALPLPRSRDPVDAALLDRPLVFGLRPEHLRLGDFPQAADEAVVDAEVVLVEPLGAAVQLTLAVHGREFITLVSAEHDKPYPGQRVKVVLGLRHSHFFDPHTGLAVSSPLRHPAVQADDELVTI